MAMSTYMNWISRSCQNSKSSYSLNNDMFQIDQNTLHLLLPGKISWMVEYLQEDYGWTLQECLNRIYHSELYRKLADESTKYWHLGPVDLYEELISEF